MLDIPMWLLELLGTVDHGGQAEIIGAIYDACAPATRGRAVDLDPLLYLVQAHPDPAVRDLAQEVIDVLREAAAQLEREWQASQPLRVVGRTVTRAGTPCHCRRRRWSSDSSETRAHGDALPPWRGVPAPPPPPQDGPGASPGNDG